MNVNFRITIVVVLLLLTVACARKVPPDKPSAATASSPPGAESYPSLAVQAKEVNDAFMRKDYDRFADLIYPKVIEMAGGREKMLATMNKELKDMEAEGVTLLESTVNAPIQFLHESGTIYAVVPTTQKAKAKNGIFQSEGAMIGISDDGGKHWSFVDASGKDQSELRALLPNVADKLNLPREKPPVKIANGA